MDFDLPTGFVQEAMSLGPAPTLVVHAGSADAAAAQGTVIVHHGLSGQKEVHGRELISLAAAGFLAIGVDAVGHGERRWPGFEERLQEAPDRWFVEAVRATASETPRLIDALAARGWARPGRIGMVGASMGAFATYGAVLQDRRIRAAVCLLGTPIWPTGASDSPHLAPERFFPVALLSQTAGADGVVSPDGARALHAALGSHYAAAPERQRYVEYPGAAHMMDESTWQRAWADSLSWLERFLR